MCVKIFKLFLLIIVFGVWQTAALAQVNFTQTAQLAPTESANNIYFAKSVAISGSTAISGAPLVDVDGMTDAGAAYIHVRGANGVWTQQAKLVPNDLLPNRFFGLSVAISGDTAFVGTSNSFYLSDYAGAVYVFTRSGATWTQTQKLSASDTAIRDGFGTALAIDGETLLVGAALADFGSVVNRGAGYVFTRTGATWTQQAKLVADDGAAVNFLGESVALDGGTAVIGAVGVKLGASVNVGAAYIFTRSGAAWTQRQKIMASDAAHQDEFGSSVGISGSTIFVGSRLANANQRVDGGAVYVFGGSGATWTQRQKLTPPSNIDGYHFGESLALEGNTAIVGANYSWISGNSRRGAAFVFRLNNNGTFWIQTQMLTASDGVSGDEFGNSVALDGGRAIVGAFFDNLRQGSAYVFETPQAAAPRTQFDFDGDGKADISVFRPSNGAWYINQSTAGFTGLTFGFGSDLLTPADFDGDGKTDVAIFRPSVGGWYRINSSNNTFTGLQWGSSTDIPLPADFDGDGKADVNVFRPSDGGWYRLNSSTGAFVGVNFGQNGDKPLIANFDGDGKSDIAVFRPSTGSFYSLDSSTGNFRGVAFGFGTDIPTMGDFDGDGKTDVAVFRPSNGGWYRLNSSTGAFFGTLFGQNGDIPIAADYDGDGKTDIAVFRNGDWYYLRSTNGGFVGQTFGFGTDKPIPSAFVP